MASHGPQPLYCTHPPTEQDCWLSKSFQNRDKAPLHKAAALLSWKYIHPAAACSGAHLWLGTDFVPLVLVTGLEGVPVAFAAAAPCVVAQRAKKDGLSAQHHCHALRQRQTAIGKSLAQHSTAQRSMTQHSCDRKGLSA